jgi:hypothetical protein
MTGISFIITTSGINDAEVRTVVDSIHAENIPEYEIIIIGGEATTVLGNNVKHIPFDETLWTHMTVHGQPGNRKYNLAVQASKYDIVVPMRDYIKLLPGWYQEFENYGLDWDICIHQEVLYTGVRGSGWRLDKYPGLPRWCMIPYDIDHFVQYMSLPGGYWVAKKAVMLKYPLDETLLWGMEEDNEWNRRIVPNCKIKCNPGCRVQYIKPKPDDANHAIDVQTMESLNDYWNAIRNWRVANVELSPQTRELQRQVIAQLPQVMQKTKL